MSKTHDVKIPDIGNYKDVPVIEVLVKNGQTVAVDEPLLVLESDKATLEIPSPKAGVVAGIRIKAGAKVNEGDVVMQLEVGEAAKADVPATPQAKLSLDEPPAPAPPAATRAGGSSSVEVKAPEKPAEKPAAEEGAPKSAPPPASPSSGEAPNAGASQAPVPDGGSAYAGPATRKFARELGVDLSNVPASGPRGRIVVEDVQNFVKSRMTSSPPAATGGREGGAGGAGIPAIPAVDFAQFGKIESKPLARIRKLSAAHLHRAWLNVPHVTQFDSADITELEAFRKAHAEDGGAKLTLLPFVMKAVGAALKAFPEFNSSLAADGESLVIKQYCNIGFAADTENGLVVPVVRDVWSKGIAQLGAECAELAKKARDGKLKGDDMKGGCFSISSLGGIGGSHFTPIVNAPEVAILGVSRAQLQPVWNGAVFAPRLLCPLSLSYDHRVIDGAYAARFIVALVKLLSDLRRLAL